MKYDVAIIGTGPAGISAALNLKLHNKNIIWFGSPDLSMKVEKSEKIANYPGLPMISGPELNERFKQQITESDLEITDKMVTNITATKNGFMLLGDNEVFEARKILMATGTVGAKPMSGEEELLGKGVSYCATCDGFFYKGKTIAVVCGARRYEHEIAYLAELAEAVYVSALYPDYEIDLPNVIKLDSPVKEIHGQERVEEIELGDGSRQPVDGIFILRTSVAPTTLLKGLTMDGPHIVVDREMKTSKEGVFAAGDCTGRPYQIAKAIGEGNIAAHSIVASLANE